MTRYYLVFAFFCCVAAQVSAQTTPTLLNKIVAIVGDEYIMLSDVEEQVALTKERSGGNLPPDYRCQVLDDLMAQKLLIYQAKIDSIEVKDEEVEGQLQARVEQILQYMGGDPKAFEEYYGQTVEEVKVEFREDLRNQMLAERMRGKILEPVTVTPAEVKEFYRDIPRDSLPYFNAEVELREIVYTPKVNEVEKKKAFDQLFELRRRIVEGGENFELVASKNSMDYGSARQGGDLGWMKRGGFVQEFEAAAYRLESNEISPIVETEFGFHVIQMIERRGNMIHCRHILIRPKITPADIARARETLDSVRTELIRDSLTFPEAVKKFSDKRAESYANGGLMVNPQTGGSQFETSELDPDVYFATEKMQPGDITQPIEMLAQDGSKVFRLVQVVSRTAPHKANLQQDFAKIQQAALANKKSTYIDSWIARKLPNTYIQYDTLFSDCSLLEKWNISK